MGERTADLTAERWRIEAEYRRRREQVKPELYAPWHPAQMFLLARRKQVAARLLHKAGVFPGVGDPCLEVGCGALGWFGDLISWGVSVSDLHGTDLDSERVGQARQVLSGADIRVGNATELPWQDNTFQLVIASTLFSSILNPRMKRLVAGEMIRVLRPGGAILWYDFTVNNPSNAEVRGVSLKEVRRLFPRLGMWWKSVTLAPPLARVVVPLSLTLATALEAMPLARTHLLAVLVKPRTHEPG